MKLSTAKKVIKEAIKSNVKTGDDARNAEYVPVKMTGGVGIGKTSVARQAAAEAFADLGIDNWKFTVVNAGTEAPDDIAGSNYYDEANGRMQKLKPWWWPQEGETHGVVFLDEIDQGDKAQQNACGPLIDERRAGPWVLPAGWVVIGAGNRKQDRAGTTTAPSQIKDRWMDCHIDLDRNETLAHWAKIGINEKIRAFIGFAGHEWLHKFDPDAASFPTPRSYERTNSIMKWDLDPVEMVEAIASKIGAGAAAAFVGFCKVYDHVPDIDELIANPKDASVPDQPDVLYAVCASLASKANNENLGAILQYCSRFEQQEFTAMIMRDVRARVGSELKRNKDYREWIMNGGGKELLV